jgi:hypothetical protein
MICARLTATTPLAAKRAPICRSEAGKLSIPPLLNLVWQK